MSMARWRSSANCAVVTARAVSSSIPAAAVAGYASNDIVADAWSVRSAADTATAGDRDGSWDAAGSARSRLRARRPCRDHAGDACASVKSATDGTCTRADVLADVVADIVAGRALPPSSMRPPSLRASPARRLDVAAAAATISATAGATIDLDATTCRLSAAARCLPTRRPRNCPNFTLAASVAFSNSAATQQAVADLVAGLFATPPSLDASVSLSGISDTRPRLREGLHLSELVEAAAATFARALEASGGDSLAPFCWCGSRCAAQQQQQSQTHRRFHGDSTVARVVFIAAVITGAVELLVSRLGLGHRLIVR
ncbi:hypothetical protein HK405_006509, partial [Cladochytrium tenue]